MTIEDLVRRGSVQRVPVDERAVERLMDDAQRHLVTASGAYEAEDLAGAFQLGYDAARKSLAALSLARGLRTRGEGAHVTLIEVIELEYSSVPGVDVVTKLDRLRRTRNRAEYAGHWFDPKEVVSGLETARAIVLWAQQALDASTRSKQ